MGPLLDIFRKGHRLARRWIDNKCHLDSGCFKRSAQLLSALRNILLPPTSSNIHWLYQRLFQYKPLERINTQSFWYSFGNSYDHRSHTLRHLCALLLC
jgi:hypothetical protein